MPLNLILTVCLLAVVLGLFIWGRWRVDLIAIGTLVALLVLGLLPAEQALYGFTNPATATIAAMFILSAGLVRTGLVRWVSRRMDKWAGKGEARLVLVVSAIAAALSAFLLNTAIVAIFIPVVIVLARNRKILPSRVLIPLSFASQVGGVCTIIGTSTNLLVNGIGINAGMQPFGFFEFAPLGLVMVAAGLVYLTAFSRWLLPKRKEGAEQVDKYRLADYLAELMVLGNSPLVGYTWEKSKAGRGTGIEMANLIREGKPVSRPQRTQLRPGDLLLLHGHIEKIMAMETEYCLQLLKNVKVRDEQLSSHESRLMEALIPPRSNLVGNTLQTSGFFRRYRASTLAIQRRGKVLKNRLADIELNPGDTLLMQVHQDDVPRLINSVNVIITNEVTELYFRRDKAIIALLVMLTVVGLAVFNVVPIMVAAIIGALGMVLTRCLTLEEAYSAIDWKIIFLLGGIIPLGLALEQHGVAQCLTETVINPLNAYGPMAILAAIYLTTAVLTELMSNAATAAVMAPIAIAIAASIGVDPRPLLVAITFAASTSFATPTGYQTNTMVYFPGGYRFADFTRIGIPLNIIFWILATLLIPVIWPF